MVLYESQLNGVKYELGTSGFLYRSNKLMYDKATSSLWSTLLGEPVIGPLVGKGISLKRRSVVTTTWGKWKKRHPKTTVLSLDTGHSRDYGEGVAYSSYFGSDDLMFTVPGRDTRLPNKREVVALRKGGDALAVDTKFLKKHSVYATQVGGDDVVILSRKGESRVYLSGAVTFKKWKGSQAVIDSDGTLWGVSEDGLTRDGGDGVTLARYPSHQSFWFGWHAQYPKTRLVK